MDTLEDGGGAGGRGRVLMGCSVADEEEQVSRGGMGHGGWGMRLVRGESEL